MLVLHNEKSKGNDFTTPSEDKVEEQPDSLNREIGIASHLSHAQYDDHTQDINFVDNWDVDEVEKTSLFQFLLKMVRANQKRAHLVSESQSSFNMDFGDNYIDNSKNGKCSLESRDTTRCSRSLKSSSETSISAPSQLFVKNSKLTENIISPSGTKHTDLQNTLNVFQYKANQHLRILCTYIVKNLMIEDHWISVILGLTQQLSDSMSTFTSHHDLMHLLRLIKIKIIPNGTLDECEIVNGVVFTIQTMHKKMKSQILDPTILLIKDSLQFDENSSKSKSKSRSLDISSNEMVSFEETLNTQAHVQFQDQVFETIQQLRPDVILVEKNSSFLLQTRLLDANITLVSNIRLKVLESLVHCTRSTLNASLFSKVDSREIWAAQKKMPEMLFHVKTFECGKSKKTCAFFEYKPRHSQTKFRETNRDRYMSILLRSAPKEQLIKVKYALKFIICANLTMQKQNALLVDLGAVANRPSDTQSLIPEEQTRTRYQYNEELILNEHYFSTCWSVYIPKMKREVINIGQLFNRNIKKGQFETDNLDYVNGQTLARDKIFNNMNLSNHDSNDSNHSSDELDFKSHHYDIPIDSTPPIVSIIETHPQTPQIMNSIVQGVDLTNRKSTESKCTYSPDAPSIYLDYYFHKNSIKLLPSSNTLSPFSISPYLKSLSQDQTILHKYSEINHFGDPVLNAKGLLHKLSLDFQEHQPIMHLPRSDYSIFPQRFLYFYSFYSLISKTQCVPFQIQMIQYATHNDMTLESFLRVCCFCQTSQCRKESCLGRLRDHQHCIIHANGRLTITNIPLYKIIPKLPQNQNLDQDIIYVWSECCSSSKSDSVNQKNETLPLKDIEIEQNITPLSLATRTLSFGVFLELFFYSNQVYCIRCYGQTFQKHLIYFYHSQQTIQFAFEQFQPLHLHLPLLKQSKALSSEFLNNACIYREIEELIRLAFKLHQRVMIELEQLQTMCIGMNNTEINDRTANWLQICQNMKEEMVSTFRMEISAISEGKSTLFKVAKIRKWLYKQVKFWDKSLSSKVTILHEEAPRASQKEELSHLFGKKDNNMNSQRDIKNQEDGLTRTLVDSNIQNPDVNVSLTNTPLNPNLATFPHGGSPSPTESPILLLPCPKEKVIIHPNKVTSSNLGNSSVELSPTSSLLLSISEHSNYNRILQILQHILQLKKMTLLDLLKDHKKVLFHNDLSLDRDIVVPIYRDEPSSWIAFTLTSRIYHEKFKQHSTQLSTSHDIYNNKLCKVEDDLDKSSCINTLRTPSICEPFDLEWRLSPLIDGKDYSMQCKIYFPIHFASLRHLLCLDESVFSQSLARCEPWKTTEKPVSIHRTLNEKFVIKQVQSIELESFIGYAQDYFNYLANVFSNPLAQTAICKIIGIYSLVLTRDGRMPIKLDLIVQENLFYGHTLTQIFDLKGSLRSRYTRQYPIPPSTSWIGATHTKNPSEECYSQTIGLNARDTKLVSMDQNFIECMYSKPICLPIHEKSLLSAIIYKDTKFLLSLNVMDYSLMVGVDKKDGQLVIGIIDYMRTYTWDKQLETLVKSTRLLGVGKGENPTILSPKQYKKRFIIAIWKYFFPIISLETQLGHKNGEMHKSRRRV